MPEMEFDLSDSRDSSSRGGRAAKAKADNAKAKAPPREGSPAAAIRKLAFSPFTVVIDTREQLPYTFDGMTDLKTGKDLIVPTVVAGLKTGDYSIQGLEDEIAIERKELSDCYNSIIHGRERFEREIARLNDLPGFAAVSIEATREQILDPILWDSSWQSRANPMSVVGTIHSWTIRYPRVHWYEAGTRRKSECWIFEMFSRYWKQKQEEGT